MRSTRTCLLCVFLLLFGAVQFAHAQRVDEIEIGETKNGAVTAITSVASFFFSADASQVLTVQLTTTSAEFVPVVMVATSDNTVLESFSAAPGTNTVGGTLTIPAEGRYFVQVQGANGQGGEFSLSLLEGDVALATPPAATPTDTSTPVLREQLHLNVTTHAQLSESEPEKQFTFSTPEVPLVVQVIAGSAAEGFDGSLTVPLAKDASGEIVGNYQAALIGGAFIVPPSSDHYRLTIGYEGSQSESVSISLFAFDGATFNPLVTPTMPPTATVAPTASATAVPRATAVIQQDVDLLLRWGHSFLTLTNVSGSALDIRTLAFAGDNRRADMAYWLISAPELDLGAFSPDACGGFRPLDYPEAPPVPPGCNQLAAWRSDDMVFFWGGPEFDVLYNGLVIATCATGAGQCGVDLPNS
jgi:hypothetical protein